MTQIIDIQADLLASKISHYLITMIGRTTEEATDEEVFNALCYSMREEIMINWLAANRTLEKNPTKTLYYFSMEFLPGRLISNTITNICALEIVTETLKKLKRDLPTLMNYEVDPGLGNGGLGRLASCFLDSLATHQYPVRAYGLRYQYGIFEQHIHANEQIEAPDNWLMKVYPWEFRRDNRTQRVKFCGRLDEPNKDNFGGGLIDAEEVAALAYDLPIVGYNPKGHFSTVTLRLWSTKESPRNFQLQRYNAGSLGLAAENTNLTDVLYPNDYHETGKRIRLKQEYLLVSASLQDMLRYHLSLFKGFEHFSDLIAIQINDTHPSLVVPELIRLLMRHHNIPWKEAVQMTHAVTGYTNHTIMQEALEEWDQSLMRYLLPRQYAIIERLNQEFCNQIRIAFPNNEQTVRELSILEGGKVRMAHLAIVGAQHINGVAELHSKILKERIFPNFYKMYPDAFMNVTNGVTQRRWLYHCNPLLAALISDKIGNKWITDFSQISQFDAFAKDPEVIKSFIEIKLHNKRSLLDAIQDMCDIANPPKFNPHALFDVQIKRFHEYKRQLMNALHVLMLYNEIKNNPDYHGRIPRLVIFAGKAAAAYTTAKNIITLICCLARRINQDDDVNKFLNVLFIPNYNVTHAEQIIPAADLSEQISTAGLEASGTGNMKLAINGALTIGTHDGANVEMKEEVNEFWPFSFGCSAEEIVAMQQNRSFQPIEVCVRNFAVQEAVEMLRNGTLAETQKEKEAFLQLYDVLLGGSADNPSDRYFVLKDLPEFYNTQKRVEALYVQKELWAEYAIHNLSRMGKFSADRSVHEYAAKIWDIKPLPLNLEILETVREEYRAHDRCRVY